MKAKYWLLMGILAVLGGCRREVYIDLEEQEFAIVSYSVEGTRLVIDSNLIFETDKKTLKEHSVKILRSLYRQVSKEYFSNVAIAAHTDDALTERSAIEITDYQAQVVAGYFWFRGIDAGEIEAEGKGFSEPISDTSTVEGLHANQRIEIFLT